MGEMDLGGDIKLTVPQLRVYLDSMRRLAEHYGKMDQIGAPHKADGIKLATNNLLKCLNLPEDWAERMDKKEVYEALRGMTSEERREAN